MKKRIYLFILVSLLGFTAKAQFIDIAEPVPFGCPSACAGSTLILKIFHVQNLPIGATVQALLSNASGSFVSGTTLINSNRFSTVSANGPWTLGSYTFSGNTNDLFFELTLPAAQAPGTNYNIRFRSAVAPFTTGNSLNLPGGTCSGLTITPAYTPLSSIASTTIGNGQWIAHAYTWTSTTSAVLSTPNLIAQQNFFGSNNYKGHFLKNSLNFDLNFTGTSGSGKMPGAVGIINDGTSFQCGNGYSTNYSLRFYRSENFIPGFYSLSLGADDGARLSIDGGSTWILDSFTEHSYSILTTNAAFPNGVCLSGPTQLVLEYFQRPVDARVSFSATLLSATITQPVNQTICEGDAASFSVGSNLAVSSYQWQQSTDGGLSFSPLSNNSTFSGTTTSTLQINASPFSLNGTLYSCILTGTCGNAYTGNAALLTLNPAVSILTQPLSEIVCVGDTANFAVTSSSQANYQWQENTGSGFLNLSNGGIYSGVNTATLSLNGVSLANDNNQYQCIVSGCGPDVNSDVADLSFTQPFITIQPEDQEFCGTKSIQLTTNANGATVFQWQYSTDGGLTFTNLVDNAQFQNTTGTVLTIVNADASMDKFLFRCRVAGCGQFSISETAKIAIQEIAIEDFVPNIFTPNGDGENDFLELKSAGLTEVKGTVLNRWGQELYNWSSADDKWDGKYNGTFINDGVYFYTLSAVSSCDGKLLEKRGTVSVYK